MIKKRRKKENIIMIVSFFFLVTVGFAYISSTLTINGVADITHNTWNLYFDNVNMSEGSIPNSGRVPTIPTGSTSTLALEWDVTFQNPEEYYEFTVDIVNSGNLDAMISSIEFQPELSDFERRAYDFKVSYVSNDAVLAPKDAIQKGTRIPIKVRITYKAEIDLSEFNSIPQEGLVNAMTLKINYEQADEDQRFVGVLKAGAKMLVDKANPITVTDYMSGNTAEMYTFQQPETEKLSARIDYRFIGDTYCVYDNGAYWEALKVQETCLTVHKITHPSGEITYDNYCRGEDGITCEALTGEKHEMNNYIYFNNDELWRIIGVFDGKIKIVKAERIDNYNLSFDCKGESIGTSISVYGSNDWSDSQLMLGFNKGNYYRDNYSRSGNSIYDSKEYLVYQVGYAPASVYPNSINYSGPSLNWSLDDTAWNQVSEEKYYLGTREDENGSAEEWYVSEKGSLKAKKNAQLTWVGKVGLMYPSDFGYTFGKNISENCYNNMYTCSGNWPKSWLHVHGEYSPTITARKGNEYVMTKDITGQLRTWRADLTSSIHPVVYLKPEIELTGTGSKIDPYRIVTS